MIYGQGDHMLDHLSHSLHTMPLFLTVGWTERPAINPGPFQFHGDPACVRMWMARRGFLFCRKGEVREIMRPVPIPIPGPDEAPDVARWGLCDGIHRDDHEFVPA